MENKDLSKLLDKFSSTVVDLGTGDGRFVYKNALKNPDTLYVGIDPSEKQLGKYAKKARRKRLENAIFLVGSVENIPNEVLGIADELKIILPWGSLLKNVVKPTLESVKGISSILKTNGSLEIILGYYPEHEPTQTERLGLPELSEFLIEQAVLTFEAGGLKLQNLKKLDREELKNIESTWGKKLGFGRNRPIFRLNLYKDLQRGEPNVYYQGETG